MWKLRVKPFRGFEETGLRVRNSARPVLAKAKVTGRKKPDERRTHEIVGRAVDASLTGRVCNGQALRSWILSFGRPARVVPSAPGARRSPGDRGGPASAMRRLTFQMLKVLPGSFGRALDGRSKARAPHLKRRKPRRRKIADSCTIKCYFWRLRCLIALGQMPK
jgi:hypothetical protein